MDTRETSRIQNEATRMVGSQRLSCEVAMGGNEPWITRDGPGLPRGQMSPLDLALGPCTLLSTAQVPTGAGWMKHIQFPFSDFPLHPNSKWKKDWIGHGEGSVTLAETGPQSHSSWNENKEAKLSKLSKLSLSGCCAVLIPSPHHSAEESLPAGSEHTRRTLIFSSFCFSLSS